MRDALATDLGAFLARVREQVSLPLAVGFGISRPEHVAAVGAMADGVIVGSALVRRLDELPASERAAGAAAFIRELRGDRIGIRPNPRPLPHGGRGVSHCNVEA